MLLEFHIDVILKVGLFYFCQQLLAFSFELSPSLFLILVGLSLLVNRVVSTASRLDAPGR